MRTLFPRLAVLGAFALAVVGCGGSNGTALPNYAGTNGANGSPGNYQSGCSTAVTGQCAQATAPPSLIPPETIDAGSTAISGVGYNTTAAVTQSAVSPPQNALPGTAPATAPTNPPFASGSHIVTFSGNALTQVILKDVALTSGVLPGGTPSIPGGTVPFNGLLYSYVTPSFTANFEYSSVVVNAWFAAPVPAPVPPATPAPPAPASVTVNLEIVGGSANATFDFRTASCGTLTTKTAPVVPTAATFTKLTCTLAALGAGNDSQAKFSNAIFPNASGVFDPVSGSTVYLVLTPSSGTFSTAVTAYQFGFGGVYATQ